MATYYAQIVRIRTTALALLAVLSVSNAPAREAAPKQPTVRRAEAIATAEAYLNFKWKASAANAFHGNDAEGIRVDTPDAGFSRPGIRPGWWEAGKANIGMPYMWGGFSTPAEFAAGVRRGLYAGDVCTSEKRRLGDAGVSKQAVGIDCSGLVSRCWKLERAYSTRELPGLCEELASYDELRPGDILNTPDNHVLLFKAFADPERTRILEYEAGSPPTWKVLLNRIPLSMLKEQGYRAYRYRGMRE
jgi:cell wall-associated NlpC family hydrolase